MRAAAALILLVAAFPPAVAAAQQPPTPQSGQVDPPGIRPRELVTPPVPLPLARAPSSITLLEGGEMETLGVRFLTDALRRVPGLEVQRISSTESNVSVRSYNDDSSSSQGILGLVDGRQVYNEFFGGVLWEALPVDLGDVERVEVVRGPSSFQYGPNAMHGLVNIVTKSPMRYLRDARGKETDEPDLSEEIVVAGSYGSYRSSTSSVTYVRREPDFAFKAKLVRDDIGEFEPSGGNAKDKAFFELRYETLLGAKDRRLDVSAGASRQKVNALIPTFGPLPAAEFAGDTVEEFVRGALTWGGPADGQFKARASFTHFEVDTVPQGVFVASPVYEPFTARVETGDLNVEYSKNLMDRHVATLGAGARYASFTTEDQDVSDGRHSTTLVSLFLQDEVEIAKGSFWLTAGGRWDNHSVAGNALSPRVAVVWRMADGEDPVQDGHFLRASAGYGYRNPSLRELWFDMPVLGGAATIVGNRRLDPEQMRSFELGYLGQPGGGARYSINAYYNLVDRLVQFLPDPSNPLLLEPQNIGKEDACGVEAEVEVPLRPWVAGFGNYAYEIRRDRDTGKRNPSGPRNKANAGLRVELPAEGLSLSLWGNFFDKTAFIDPAGGAVIGAVDDYFLLNARIACRLPWGRGDARVYVQAFNMLDHDHREHPEGDRYGLLLVAGFEARW
jgi:outer membrane receptor protein involved in Fe transport